MNWYKTICVCVKLIKRFLHIRIYCRFLFVTSVIMCVHTCLTYQIKGEIPVYLNLLSQRKIIVVLIKVKND